MTGRQSQRVTFTVRYDQFMYFLLFRYIIRIGSSNRYCVWFNKNDLFIVFIVITVVMVIMVVMVFTFDTCDFVRKSDSEYLKESIVIIIIN